MTTRANNLSQSSYTLINLVDGLKSEIATMKSESGDLPVSLKQKLAESLERCQTAATEYRTTLQNLPKELRRRAFVQNMLVELGQFETEVRDNLKSIQESNRFQNWREQASQHWADAQKRMDVFRTHLHQVREKAVALENDPIVQKFMRGETILACRKNIQWRRKIGHAMMGTFFVYFLIYTGLPKALTWSLTTVFVISCLALEISRHMSPSVNKWVCKWFKPVMREAEKTRVNSAIFYIAAALFVYFLFPVEIAVLSVLFLAIGDPVAGIFGVFFGKTKISEHTSLEGFIACWAACGLIALVMHAYVFATQISIPGLIALSLFSGLAGAFAESSFKKIDDNLVMPIVSAFLLLGLSFLFGV